MGSNLHAQSPFVSSPLASLAPRFRIVSGSNQPQIEMSGTTGAVYQVTASSNLVEWQTIGQIDSSAAITLAFDPALTGSPARFYRAQAVTYPFYALKPFTEVVLDDFENADDWTVAGATKSADTNLFVSGTQSLKLLPTGTGPMYLKKSINLGFSEVKSVSLWVYLTGDSPRRLDVSFSSTSKYSKNIYKTIWYPSTGAWLPIVLNPHSFTEYNGESRTNRMVLAVLSTQYATNTSGAVNWDLFTYKTGGRARPKAVLTFDDGDKSVITTAYPIMRARGFAATAFIIGRAIGGVSWMSLADLNLLYSNGWDISNHTSNHATLDGLTQSDAEQEIQGCIDFIEASGFTRNNMARFLAYPQGSYNHSSVAIGAAHARGVLAARTVDSFGVVNHDYQPLLELPAYPLYYGVSLATAKSYVDEIIQNQGVGCFYLHAIGDVSNSYHWPEQSFSAF